VLKAGWEGAGNTNQKGSAGTCPTCQQCVGDKCVADDGAALPQTPNDCSVAVCRGGSPTTVPDNTDHDATSCCTILGVQPKFGNSLETLATLCTPKQVTDKEQRHIVDGCSLPKYLAVITPGLSVQNPVGGIWGLFSSTFGKDQGATIPNQAAALPLPCNQHDICYQTCGKSQATCDANIFTDMVRVCDAAYPSATCPYSGLEALEKCVIGDVASNYFIERDRCTAYANAYKWGLGKFGAKFWALDQIQFCKCCE
jgi:hypothetical protein